MSERISKDVSERMSDRILNDMSERISKGMSDRIFERILEDMLKGLA